MHSKRNFLFHLYMAAFLIYLLVPLLVMGGAAFNDSSIQMIDSSSHRRQLAGQINTL